MSHIPKVIQDIVNNDICIGCGICTSVCPSHALKMDWNEDGFYEPTQIEECDKNGKCISVCPFNPDLTLNEDDLAQEFLKDNGTQRSYRIGNYINLYAGYSSKYRKTSSSGGVATYVLNELLSRNIVNNIVSVKETEKNSKLFEYAISTKKEDIVKSSKTRYYPVTLSKVIETIKSRDETFAVVGVACFLKGLRLAQINDPDLKKKVKFTVGIICGGVKSKFFTEYLAKKISFDIDSINKTDYRIKDTNSKASNYSFGAFDNNQFSSLRMKEVGDMWGTGLFKANACDFCDDVTTELADISVGDAWLEPFVSDGRGDNIVITRSKLAEKIVFDGITKKELTLDILTEKEIIQSQSGSFNHRQKASLFRANLKNKLGYSVPFKREKFNERIVLAEKIVQIFRMLTRKKSIEIWRSNKDPKIFEKRISPYLKTLKFSTRVNHLMRKVFKR